MRDRRNGLIFPKRAFHQLRKLLLEIIGVVDRRMNSIVLADQHMPAALAVGPRLDFRSNRVLGPCHWPRGFVCAHPASTMRMRKMADRLDVNIVAPYSGGMAIRVDIISIGTLSRNRLWNETQAVRTPHATTSLVRVGKRNILIDPGLPAQALGARLFERTGLRPEQIDTVFLTNFRPAHRAGLPLFSSAKMYIHETEQAAMRQHIERLIEDAPEADIDRKLLAQELTLLDSLTPAEDKLAEHLDLFPLPGYTPGTCGLLVAARPTRR
jgi:hypothetical protein